MSALSTVIPDLIRNLYKYFYGSPIRSGMTRRGGFTLVELLVVVAIIGVLSTIGITVFTGARSSANDAKIKADIDAIKKAYEASYDPISDTYRPLTDADFSGGSIPAQPNGSSYPGLIIANQGGYKICAPQSSGTDYCTASSQGSQAAYYVSLPSSVVGFIDKKTINVTNSGTSLTDYQIPITLDTQSLILAGKMQSNCQDITILDASNNTLPYWIEEGSFPCNSTTTKIWTKVVSVPNGTTTLSLFYNNPSAQASANGDNVFIFFDDFNGSVNSSKWTQSTVGTATISLNGGTIEAFSNIGKSELTGKTNILSDDTFLVEKRIKFVLVGIPNRNRFGPGSASADSGIFSFGDNSTLTVYWDVNSGTIIPLNQYLHIKRTYSEAGFTWNIDNDNRTASIYTKSISQSLSAPQYVFLSTGDSGVGGGGHFYVDWVFARKYAATEPNVVVAP